MANIEILHTQEEILNTSKYLRLLNDLKIIEANIKSTTHSYSSSSIFLNKLTNFGKDTKRFFSKNDEKKRKCLESLDRFKAKKYKTIDERYIKSVVDKVFEDDKYGMSKLLLAVTIILDKEFEYQYEEEGLQEISNILFRNPSELGRLKNELYNTYKSITGTSLSSTQCKALFAFAVASIVGSFALPIIAVGGLSASASTTTAALATLGLADMQLGVGVLAAETILFTASMVGMCYGAMKLYNLKEVRQKFRTASVEEQALYLTIQALYINKALSLLDQDEFKEQIDYVSKSIATMKSDLDFYTFVEKENLDLNKKKITLFHNFDNCLMKVLKI